MVANMNPDYVTCSVHQKRGYYSRKAANQAARVYHPGEHMDSYPCELGTGLWHIGHLPKRVVTRGVPRDIATGKRS